MDNFNKQDAILQDREDLDTTIGDDEGQAAEPPKKKKIKSRALSEEVNQTLIGENSLDFTTLAPKPKKKVRKAKKVAGSEIDSDRDSKSDEDLSQPLKTEDENWW